MTTPTRAEAAAEVAHRADERANTALTNISRVEHALTDRIDHLEAVVEKGFAKLFDKLDGMKTDVSKEVAEVRTEITNLKIENGKRSAVERWAKWLVGIVMSLAALAVTIALGLAGLFGLGGNPPSHH